MQQLEIPFAPPQRYQIGQIVPLMTQTGRVEEWAVSQADYRQHSIVWDGQIGREIQPFNWWYKLVEHGPVVYGFSRWTMREDALIREEEKANGATRI